MDVTVLARGHIGLAVLAAAAGVFPTAAQAGSGPCIPGTKAPLCDIQTGKVGPVDDGDTINVDIDDDGTRKQAKVRLTGVQAMELTVYGKKKGRKGECNGVAAAERLEELIRAGKSAVRLAAHDTGSTTGERGRLRRSVAVKSGGKWRDVGAVLIEEGLALWFANPVEWAWNRSYSRLAEEAAAKGIGIWDTDSCGAGPSQESPLTMKVRWDAEDVDSKNINGEWVRITNGDPLNAVPLAGWWFRDSHLRRYTFPRGAEIAPGGSIKLHVGSAPGKAAMKPKAKPPKGPKGPPVAPGTTSFYWGLAENIFENVSDDAKQIGDGGYLFDPQGDLRAWSQYPCRTTCPDPLAGALKIEATYKAPEYVTVTNISAAPVDLGEAEVESSPWFYEIAPGTVLAPGESFKLWIMQGPDAESAFERNWGFDRYLLSDQKDVVTIRNRRGAPVACHAWGGEPCPSV